MIQGGGYDENLKEQKLSLSKVNLQRTVLKTLSHTRGVISMARAQDYDSATSQFFIVQKMRLTLMVNMPHSAELQRVWI